MTIHIKLQAKILLFGTSRSTSVYLYKDPICSQCQDAPLNTIQITFAEPFKLTLTNPKQYKTPSAVFRNGVQLTTVMRIITQLTEVLVGGCCCGCCCSCEVLVVVLPEESVLETAADTGTCARFICQQIPNYPTRHNTQTSLSLQHLH